jgi:tetratricopeptide (TPR) repeat protein
MKHILHILLVALAFTSCKTSKDYLQRSNEDKTLFDIIKKLNKSANDADALKALPIVFDNVTKLHVNKIAKYSNYKELSRWDKMIDEYTALQKIYDAVINSPATSNVVTATNYQNDIYTTKQTAAEEYYNTALLLMQNQNRDEIKKAYAYFKKADKYVPNYYNAKTKMQEAFDAATINVLINPVQDNSFFFNTGWGNTGYNYSNEYFQQNLVRELGGQNSSRYPAKFYTEWEARRDNVKPDWVVNLTIQNLNISGPKKSFDQSRRSESVEIGRDTLNRPIYQTVYATINYATTSIDANVKMNVSIIDANTRGVILSQSYRESYNWSHTETTDIGDSRALNEYDRGRAESNQPTNIQPSREVILNNLYRKIYPQVRNKIAYAVDW